MAVKQKLSYTGLIYILPWLVGFLILQFMPLITSLWYSFTNFQLIGSTKFVGLKNFVDIFTTDPQFLNSLKVTFLFVLIAVPMKIIFALIIAVVLNQKWTGINFFRTLYYMPSILGGSIAISVLWRFLFMKQGVVNQIISVIGIPPADWLGNPKIALFTVSLVTVWQFGSSMVLFLAGLKQIPESLYEAARIDGAGRLRVFFRVTLPMLTPIVFFNLIMQMINAFQEFTTAFVITQGGPLKSTYLYGLMLYEQGFKFFKMGYASALSWILFVVIFFFTSLTFKSSESWVHYGDKI
jgi:oligogalacturonide transport system permease protein